MFNIRHVLKQHVEPKHFKVIQKAFDLYIHSLFKLVVTNTDHFSCFLQAPGLHTVFFPTFSMLQIRLLVTMPRGFSQKPNSLRITSPNIENTH